MRLTVLAPQTTGFYVELDGETVFMTVENQEKTMLLTAGEHVVAVYDQLSAPLAVNMVLDLMKTVNLSTEDGISDKILHFTVEEETPLTLSVHYGKYTEIDFRYDEAFEAGTSGRSVEVVLSEQEQSEETAKKLNKTILTGILALVFTVTSVFVWINASAPVGARIVMPTAAVIFWILFMISVGGTAKTRMITMVTAADADIFREVFFRHVESKESALHRKCGYHTFLWGNFDEDGDFYFCLHQKQRYQKLDLEERATTLLGNIHTANGKTEISYSFRYSRLWKCLSFVFSLVPAAMGIFLVISVSKTHPAVWVAAGFLWALALFLLFSCLFHFDRLFLKKQLLRIVRESEGRAAEKKSCE